MLYPLADQKAPILDEVREVVNFYQELLEYEKSSINKEKEEKKYDSNFN